MQKALNFNYVVVIYVKGSAYGIQFEIWAIMMQLALWTILVWLINKGVL